MHLNFWNTGPGKGLKEQFSHSIDTEKRPREVRAFSKVTQLLPNLGLQFRSPVPLSQTFSKWGPLLVQI